jgi:hypothetical protein
MSSIETVSLGVGLAYILYNLFYKWIDIGWIPNAEPFNCEFCVSFWSAMIVFGLTLDPFLILSPIIYRVLTLIIKRI